MTADDEWALVDRVKAGGPDAANAFTALYRRYRPVVEKMLYNRSSFNRDLAEDLTAETFTKAWARIGGLERQPGHNPGAWIVTIARNLLFDYYKSGRNRFEWAVFAPVGDDVDNLETGIVRADPDPGPAEQAETNAVVAMVRAAVAALPAQQREVVRLRYLEERPIAEVVALLGTNEGQIKAMAYRAWANLRKTLTEAAAA